MKIDQRNEIRAMILFYLVLLLGVSYAMIRLLFVIMAENGTIDLG